MFSDATNINLFPSGTLAEQESWVYQFSEFNNVTINEFDAGPIQDAKKTLINHPAGLHLAMIGNLKAEEENWSLTNQNDK